MISHFLYLCDKAPSFLRAAWTPVGLLFFFPARMYSVPGESDRENGPGKRNGPRKIPLEIGQSACYAVWYWSANTYLTGMYIMYSYT